MIDTLEVEIPAPPHGGEDDGRILLANVSGRFSRTATYATLCAHPA